MYVHAYTASKVCSPVCLPNEVSRVYHYNDFYDHSRTGVSHARNLSRRESGTGRWQVSAWVRPCHTQPSKSMTIVRFIWGSLSFGNMRCSVSWGRLDHLPGHQTKAHVGTLPSPVSPCSWCCLLLLPRALPGGRRATKSPGVISLT